MSVWRVGRCQHDVLDLKFYIGEEETFARESYLFTEKLSNVMYNSAERNNLKNVHFRCLEGIVHSWLKSPSVLWWLVSDVSRETGFVWAFANQHFHYDDVSSHGAFHYDDVPSLGAFHYDDVSSLRAFHYDDVSSLGAFHYDNVPSLGAFCVSKKCLMFQN